MANRMNGKRTLLLATAASLALAVVCYFIAPNTGFGLRLNHSNSIPIGLYRTVKQSNILVFCPDAAVSAETIHRHYREWRRLGAERCADGYEPIVKTIAAVPGDSVVVTPSYIAVNDHILPHTAALSFDHQHRAMQPWPPGTYSVAPGTVWVLSTTNANSYDSRYFGPVPDSWMRGYVAPLWTFR